MMASSTFLLVLLAMLIGSAVLTGPLIWVGLRWAKIEGATLGRIVLTVLPIFLTQLAIACGAYLWEPGDFTFRMTLLLAGLTLGLLIPWFVIKLFFSLRWLCAAQACLPTVLAPVIIFGTSVLFIKPFVAEAFTIPTNGMAPTLLGNHRQVTCNVCGSPAYSSMPREEQVGSIPQPVICGEHFHITEHDGPPEAIGRGDRIMVSKIGNLARWDLLVFRFPGDPTKNYVQRLVGLPGEEITIKDGLVWADGQKLTPPSSLAGIEYFSNLPDMPDSFGALAGSPEHPALLGDDEYFTLGDFSVSSSDSRLWFQGAPGHPAYAVPEDHIIGVVSNIYWPPARWRSFR